MESRPEVETKPEVEIPAEIVFTVSTSDGEGLGATRPETAAKQADSVSLVAPRDKPETALTLLLPARQEIPSETTQKSPKPIFHKS